MRRFGVRRPFERLRDAARISLVRTSASIVGTTAVTAGFGYVYWIAAAHVYPARAVGVAAALLSAMALTSAVATLGIHSALVEVLPKRQAGPAWSRAVSAGLVGAGVAAAALSLLALVVLRYLSHELSHALARPVYAALFCCGVVVTTVSVILDYTFVAERAADRMLARNMVFAVLKIPLLAIPLVGLSRGAAGILGSWVAAAVVALGYGFVLAARLSRGFRPCLRGIVPELRILGPSLLGQHTINLAAALPAFLLPLVITARLTPAETAYFYTTWMLGSIFFIVSPAAALALFAEGSHRDDDLGRTVRRAAGLIALLLAPLMLVFLVAGSPILSLFGAAYAQEGSVLLMVLVLSAIPDAITNLYVAVMRVKGRLRHAAALNCAMAITTIVLAWVLVGYLGIAGGGWAWLVAQTLGALYVCVRVVSERRALRRFAVLTPPGSEAV